MNRPNRSNHNMPVNPFRPATRQQLKLRLSIDGPGGAGKTHSALLIAAGMGCENIFMVDTEHGSGKLEAGKPGIPDFNHTTLEPPYTPERYLDLCHAAVYYGADCIIIDSLSHAWSGTGGLLDEKEQIIQRSKKDSFRVWAQMTPRQTWFLDSLLALNCHLIVTMRTKTAWEMQPDQNNKLRPVKLGLKPDQREDVDYLFTVAWNMSPYGHIAYCSKDRTELFDGREFQPSHEDGRKIIEWLNSAPAPVQVHPEPMPPVNNQEPEFIPATQKQINFIRKLMKSSVFDDEERKKGEDLINDKKTDVNLASRFIDRLKNLIDERKMTEGTEEKSKKKFICYKCGKKITATQKEIEKQGWTWECMTGSDRYIWWKCPDCLIPKGTPKELREKASAIRQSAQRSDDSSAYHSEMSEADKLERQADEIERQNQDKTETATEEQVKELKREFIRYGLLGEQKENFLCHVEDLSELKRDSFAFAKELLVNFGSYFEGWGGHSVNRSFSDGKAPDDKASDSHNDQNGNT